MYINMPGVGMGTEKALGSTRPLPSSSYSWIRILMNNKKIGSTAWEESRAWVWRAIPPSGWTEREREISLEVGERCNESWEEGEKHTPRVFRAKNQENREYCMAWRKRKWELTKTIPESKVKGGEKLSVPLSVTEKSPVWGQERCRVTDGSLSAPVSEFPEP